MAPSVPVQALNPAFRLGPARMILPDERPVPVYVGDDRYQTMWLGPLCDQPQPPSPADLLRAAGLYLLAEVMDAAADASKTYA